MGVPHIGDEGIPSGPLDKWMSALPLCNSSTYKTIEFNTIRLFILKINVALQAFLGLSDMEHAHFLNSTGDIYWYFSKLTR